VQRTITRVSEDGEKVMKEGVMLHPRLEAWDEASAYRRVEVITGRRQRRRWTAEEKALIIAESAVPGANISDVARRHGVNRGLLTVWRRQAGFGPVDSAGNAGSTTFVPVEIDRELGGQNGDDHRPRQPDCGAGRIELDLRTGRLIISGTVDAALAAAVIGAARGRQ
jgi:transposase